MSERLTDREFMFTSIFCVGLFLSSLLCFGFAITLIELSALPKAIYLSLTGLLSLSFFAAVANSGVNHQLWERIGVWTHPPLNEVTGDE